MNNITRYGIGQAVTVGAVIEIDGLHLKTTPMAVPEVNSYECEDCYGAGVRSKCDKLPLCARAHYPSTEAGVKFVFDLTHEPTVQRIALMRLRGEL